MTTQSSEQNAARRAAWDRFLAARAAHEAAMAAYQAEVRDLPILCEPQPAVRTLEWRARLSREVSACAERHALKARYDALQTTRMALWGPSR